MIARVQETTEGFVIVIPPAEAKAWGLRENFPLEVHRVGSTSEDDAPELIQARHQEVLKIAEQVIEEHAAAFREVAKGPEGPGPYGDV
jgi:hypothetical protein